MANPYYSGLTYLWSPVPPGDWWAGHCVQGLDVRAGASQPVRASG